LLQDRHWFTLAAVLLRAVAAAWEDGSPDRAIVTRSCEHCSQARGRPRLPEIGLEVSVSHSGDFVAVAATVAGPVGVDIELITDIDFAPLLDAVCAQN
jgi:4'-phosphopantetheinyl transferase